MSPQVTVVLDARLLADYARIDGASVSLGELLSVVADDPTTCVGVPRACLVEAMAALSGAADIERLHRLVDLQCVKLLEHSQAPWTEEVVWRRRLGDHARTAATLAAIHYRAVVATADAHAYGGKVSVLDLG